MEKSYSSGERKDGPQDLSGNRSVSAGQHPAYGDEASQRNGKDKLFCRSGTLPEPCRFPSLRMNTAAASGGAEDKYGKIILMNNQDRLFQAGHYIEEEKAVKRYRIKISRRVSNQSERDQFSFGMIGDGNSKATAGERLESLIAEQDEIAVTFENLVNRNGFALDFNRHGGWGKICCIATAFTGYLRAGDELFEKALLVLWLAWEGHPDSLRHEVLDSVLRFLEIYDGEIDLDRLVTQLCLVDPIRIWENGRKAGNRFSGYRRYLFQIYQQYICRDPKYYLPRKF